MRRGVFALIVAFAAACALATAAACDGESSFVIPRGDAGAPSSRYEAACSAWARSFCAFQAQCPADYVRWTEGQCAPRMTLECEVIASDPHVAFDPARAAACPEPEAGTCDVVGGDLCLRPGRAPVGAPCLVGEACQTGNCEYAFDSLGEVSTCGTCAPAPCGGTCPAGQACTFELDGATSCVRYAAAGEPCATPSDCASFYCAPTGRCGARAQPGEPCGDGTSGPPCAAGDTYCDGATARCQKYVVAGYGEPCAPSGTTHYQCAGQGTCDFVNDVCIPPAADGAFCDDMQGLDCLLPARCIGHRCVFPDPARCGAP